MKAAFSFLFGFTTMVLWASWLMMLCIGGLFGLDVVNASVGFFESIPFGLGFVTFGLLPFSALLLASAVGAGQEQKKGPTSLSESRASYRGNRCGR